MLLVALKMLIGHRASFVGVIFGIFLATLLISQQSAIFLGLASRSYRIVTDIPAANIWILDPATEDDSKVRELPESSLDIVRSTPGVAWASPLGITTASVVTQTGAYEVCRLHGIDGASLIGAPTEMISGSTRDLRRSGGVIVDVYSANSILAKTAADGTKIPLVVGDELEINGHHAVVVGIGMITRGFYPNPVIFTSYDSFRNFTNPSSRRISYIIAKNSAETSVEEVCQRINNHSGLMAVSKKDFEWMIIRSFLKTGVLINFGLSVALGIIIGFSIAGQIFYIMTLENIKYYALIKAMGGGQGMILKMILAQALLVGIIGFTLGIAATVMWGSAIQGTALAFLFPWQLLLFTALIVLLICFFAAGLSIKKVFQADPKVLMGN